MASFQLAASVVLLVAAAALTPAALSAATTCKSQKFSTPNKSFSACTDLPYLSASLHYTYDAAKSTLSMAFRAPPAKPSGWVAWAINPTDTGMAGSQALLAHKSSNGSVAVSTLSIASYSSLTPGPLSIKVTGLSAESDSASDALTIFATWHLPSDSKSVNQVWQVGPSVTDGVPAKHDFAQANLLSKSKLHLSSSSSSSSSAPAESPAESPSTGAPSSAAKATGSAAPAPASGKNAAARALTGLSGSGVLLMAAATAFGLILS